MARAHGKPLSNEKVITLLAEVDLNDDGELDFEEFKGVLESGPNMSDDWAAVHKVSGWGVYCHDFCRLPVPVTSCRF